MSLNPTNPYDIDPHIAELYYVLQPGLDDVRFILRLLGGQSGLSVLEPFCGTGRATLPLAAEGHSVTGLALIGGHAGAGAPIRPPPCRPRCRRTLHSCRWM